MSLNPLDWSVIVSYLLVLIGMSAVIGRFQKSETDYFLGGRNISSPAIALSIMATQCGSISIISAPAFVALKEGGGLLWLQYEFAVPLAMVFLMICFVPCFYRLNITTVYEYLENRFDYTVRWLMSLLFQLSRGLATGVAVYAVSIVTAVCFNIPLWFAILLTGFISTLYTMMGGIKAVIYTDALQLLILWGAVFICLGYGLPMLGNWQDIVHVLRDANLTAVDFHHHGFGDGHTFSFWPMVLGGLFLYVSYYGCDQSQIQRVLSSHSIKESNRSLFLNGLLRFPLVLSYCALGVFMIAFLTYNPEFRSLLPPDHYDYLVPLFIVNHLPHGVIGFILVGIFAAAMSSIDSAFNSLSATTLKDILIRSQSLNNYISKKFVFYSRLTTLFWGTACTLFAFLVGNISSTVIEGINMIGSVFYGPILATFALGILTQSAKSVGVIIGLFSGILFNLILWIFFPQISWLWWNPIGCFCTFGIGIVLSRSSKKESSTNGSLTFDFSKGWIKRLQISTDARRWYAILIFYFLLIVLVGWGINQFKW